MIIHRDLEQSFLMMHLDRAQNAAIPVRIIALPKSQRIGVWM